MKLTFSILFLGWWLTGENWQARGDLSKPSISISPTTPITQGGNVDIHCHTNSNSKKLFELYKDNPHQRELLIQMVAGKAATFQIRYAQVTSGGLYACRYCIESRNHYFCSTLSNLVKIFITGQLNAVPFLSENSSSVVTVGENITISCKSDKPPNAKFRLYKDQSLSPLAAKKEEQNEAVFLIDNATPSDGGIYQCKYCLGTEFSELCSHYSNSKHVFLRDPGFPKPSIKAFPSQEVAPGLNVTIECQGPEKNLNVSLYKSSTLIASQITEPDSNTTRFSLSMVNFNDTGNYTCQYHIRTSPFVWSPLSELITIVVRGKDPISLDKRIIQAGAGAGCLFLVLLLLLLAFVLYRKRKRGSTISERPQPLPMKETNKPLEPEAEDDPSGVSYAELKLQSPNTKQTANPDCVPESCVYASVANNKTRTSQDLPFNQNTN